MWTIHQFPLCPFSRKVRILLREKGVPFALQRLDPWKAAEFYMASFGMTKVGENTSRFTGELSKLTDNLTSLGKVYGSMLSAMKRSGN